MRPDDPFPAFTFRLSLGHIEVAGFSECTGLELETKIFEYKEGGVNTHSLRFPERAEVRNVVLKRGLTRSDDLYDWCLDVAQGTFQHDNQRPSRQSGATDAGSTQHDSDRSVSISLLDTEGEVVKEWALKRAFPVKWTGPELKATDSAMAFESIELAHEGLERVV